ncbi:MAG TPA: hypothetical protein VEL47_08230 [Myxococcota bacterium]|nr:hypothetical protein [Myxococcota bacterium]
MKRWVIALLAFSFLAPLSAEPQGHTEGQHHTHENGLANGIGAGGSVYWTWGFMYRRHFHHNFGFSANLGAWFDNSHGHVGTSLGLLYSLAHYKFARSSLPDSSIRVYLAGFLSPIYDRNSSIYLKDSQRVNSFHFGFGAGPGVEYFFNRHFALHVEIPWMTFFRLANNTVSFRDSYPHVGGGFIYYF